MKVIECLAAGLALVGGAAIAEEPAEHVQEVTAGLFVVTGLTESGNPAFLITSEGVAVIDAGDSPAAGRRIVELVRSRTDKPIRYLILTHYHSDHTQGVESFPEGTQVIGRQKVEANMRRAHVALLEEYPKVLTSQREKVGKLRQAHDPALQAEQKRLADNEQAYENVRASRVVPPQILFEGQLTLRLGGEVIEVVSPGSTHTNDSAVVRFPSRKAVHLGDMLFAQSHPYIDARAEADTRQWIDYLDGVQAWDVDVVIPGHGPVGGKAAVAAQVGYLADLRREVAAAIASGADLPAAQAKVSKAMLERYGGYEWPEGLTYGISAVYKELGAAAPKR
jgi:glyoxylase-like metal-dependent hydrolase (beta-lactamase superfamily II)